MLLTGAIGWDRVGDCAPAKASLFWCVFSREGRLVPRMGPTTNSGIQGALWPDIMPVQAQPACIREIGRRRNGRPGLLPSHREMPKFVGLVLASASRSRLDVLRLLGLHFRVHPAEIDERSITGQTPDDLVLELSRRKALAVAAHYRDSLIVGADSVIWHACSVLGKPADAQEARMMLRSMSGTTHTVISGITIVDCIHATHRSRVVKTQVTFRPLSLEAIDRYVATGEPIGKAGAYALQGAGAILVARIDGEYSNVYGLPITCFVDLLDELGYELL